MKSDPLSPRAPRVPELQNIRNQRPVVSGGQSARDFERGARGPRGQVARGFERRAPRSSETDDPSPLVLYRRPPASLKRSRLEQFARVVRDQVTRGREFHCLVTGDTELRSLNRRFRGKDAPTDVLSFPSGARNPIGEIAISLGRARPQARERRHPIETEVCILMLHGVLHLLGMDHETDNGRMARAEVRWQRKLGLPAGLIERTTVAQALPGDFAS